MKSSPISISVLIPNYNWDVSNLIKALHTQLMELGNPFEILCFDDYLDEEYNQSLEHLNQLENVTYRTNDYQTGRSLNRNHLINASKHDYLLIIDGDAKVSKRNFIKTYIDNAQHDTVLCGGTAYEEKPSDPNIQLRWTVGKSKEEILPEIRNKKPFNSFSTFNFFLPKSIFNTIQFNNELTQYGHEDTLFGIELQNNGYGVLHIDNPLVHLGLDDNAVFLKKTRDGLENLKYLISHHILEDNIKIASWFKTIRRLGLKKPIAILYSMLNKKLEANLNSKRPNLYYYDFYKLGYLCSI